MGSAQIGVEIIVAGKLIIEGTFGVAYLLKNLCHIFKFQILNHFL
jgi:hypothetical protein